jgi:hypothetical protein
VIEEEEALWNGDKHGEAEVTPTKACSSAFTSACSHQEQIQGLRFEQSASKYLSTDIFAYTGCKNDDMKDCV